MIGIDTTHLAKIARTHGLSGKEMRGGSNEILKCLRGFKKRGQEFHIIVDDHAIQKEILSFCRSVKGKYKDVVVLGIGGSALGASCLAQSLSHLYENELLKRKNPRLHVLDNIDPEMIAGIEDVIEYPKTLFIVVTKSGTTAETISQYLYFRKQCERKKLSFQKHFVFVTDPKKGTLRNEAEAKGAKVFDVPKKVEGRFSVFSSVSLLPAALIGIDIEALLRGARKMRDSFMNKNIDRNLPFRLAKIQYLMYEKGKRIHALIPYSARLTRFAEWYRQILAESIGKKKNDDGKIVHTGITPLSAIGVTDQHSQLQLFNEGPNDKFFMFLDVENRGRKVSIPSSASKEFSYLKGVDFGTLMRTEMRGTVSSLTENERPSITLTLDQVDEENLGALLFLFQGATAFLGELFHVNAFDQPGVELSKQLTRELLRTYEI